MPATKIAKHQDLFKKFGLLGAMMESQIVSSFVIRMPFGLKVLVEKQNPNKVY